MAILNKFVPLGPSRTPRFPRVLNVLRYVVASALTIAAYSGLAFAVTYAVVKAARLAG
jgi:hypothetical protein